MNNVFSVLMSVYAKENPSFLEASLNSLVGQTLLPLKIVVVKDGRLTEALDNVLNKFQQRHSGLFNIIGYEQNQGLGPALNYGLNQIKTEYVFRMDADDIAVPERFERQMEFLNANSEIDLLGSNTLEFVDDPSEPLRVKSVPQTHNEILLQARLKNPINHMTVGFKKSKVIAAGGYQNDPFFEDYSLWIRMLKLGMRFHNLQDPLVLARVGNDMVGKRHGVKYSKYEINHFRKMYNLSFITRVQFFKAICMRVPLRLMPKGILSTFYNFALRKKI